MTYRVVMEGWANVTVTSPAPSISSSPFGASKRATCSASGSVGYPPIPTDALIANAQDALGIGSDQ